MAYQPNIPLATDRLKDSQADIQGNFQELNTYLNVNHTAIDGTADQGKHKFVTMPIQGAAPGTLANELAMYTKLSAFTGQNEVFIQRSDSGPEIQVTGATSIGSLNSQDGVGYLPLGNGYMIKWFTQAVTNVSIPSQDFIVYDLAYTTTGAIPPFTSTPVYINATQLSGNPFGVVLNAMRNNLNSATVVRLSIYNPGTQSLNITSMRVHIIAIGR